MTKPNDSGFETLAGARSSTTRGPIHAAHGTELTARSWQTEAPLRMLMNNLDPENAENPAELVVYGGTGKAARNWESYDALVRTLTTLADDETMLVQSGKPVGVMRTHEWAPRVLIANSNLVGDWANWEEFRRLEELGLTMYGQMTAGSWIYIGTQGILQGTFETFAAVADKRFDGTLAGTITLTAGLGGMGGAQPLAVTMNDGVAICVECDQSRITRRIEHRYLDVQADSLEHAVELAVEARDARKPLSIGVLGNAAELFPALLEMDAPIDVVTDQTSAHDPLSYLPVGVPFAEWHDAAKRDPGGFTKDAQASMATHVRAMVEFQDKGAEVFDYGNSIRDEARKGGYDRAFEFPGFVPAYIRPLFCEGKGPFRWAALSGDPADIAATDRAILELFPDNERLHKWITMAGERVAFQGLPARICWLGYGERHLAGLKFNEMVASGELKAPIVIGRDHLDCGFGGLAVPRDRVDARRLRCHRRLAAAERAREHRVRRLVGLDPPRRRRRHGPLHPRRPGVRRRRHRPCRAEDRARAHQRPGHGRDPARGRRLRPRCRGGRGARRTRSGARGVSPGPTPACPNARASANAATSGAGASCWPQLVPVPAAGAGRFCARRPRRRSRQRSTSSSISRVGVTTGGPPCSCRRASMTLRLKSSSTRRTSLLGGLPVEQAVELEVLLAQLQRRRQDTGDVLALDQLAQPPVPVVRRPEVTQRLAVARQVVEVAAFHRLLDLQVDPQRLLPDAGLRGPRAGAFIGLVSVVARLLGSLGAAAATSRGSRTSRFTSPSSVATAPSSIGRRVAECSGHTKAPDQRVRGLVCL